MERRRGDCDGDGGVLVGAYDATYDAINLAIGSTRSTGVITPRESQDDDWGTALTMAKTKSQARARHTESTQRSTAINDGGGSRVGTTTVGAEGGDETSTTSSS